MTSPYGKNLHQMENVTVGEFAFTTQESGNYMACFTADTKSHGNKNVSISVDWKTGIAAKDWKNIAKKEKIEVSFHRLFLHFQRHLKYDLVFVNVGSGAGDKET